MIKERMNKVFIKSFRMRIFFERTNKNELELKRMSNEPE
jgi:hypothetical protein